MSHGPAHADGRCAEDCILTTPDERRELEWLREVITALAELHRANTHFPYYCVTCRSKMPCSTAAAAAVPVRELRGDPQ